ncbi:MAG TPA: STAS domain-containing protein [Anaerolineaceae bacterium]|nr:STAS domain-containing protein [Anaerolineaceae bacterium]
MVSTPFEAAVRFEEGTARIDLAGRIDASAEQELNEAYDQAEAQGGNTVVLNFHRVTYINSTGIALIVGLLARARKSHRQLAVYGLNDHYQEIFRITRLSDFMTVYPDETSFQADDPVDQRPVGPA